MRKFKFNLESLLVVRGWEETRALQALASANAAISDLEERLARSEQALEKAYAAWEDSGSTRFSPTDRHALVSQTAQIQAQIGQSRQQLVEMQKKRTQAMDTLRSASREKKVVESLKEKRFEAHRAESYRQEAIEIEDVFNARRSAS